MILTLIKNEFIKLFKRPKTWVLLGLFFLSAAGLTGLSYLEEKNTLDNINPKYRIEIEKSNLEHYKENVKIAEKEWKNSKNAQEKESNLKWLEQSKIDLENVQDEIKRLEKLIENPPTWQEELKEQIKAREESLKYMESDGVYSKAQIEADKEWLELDKYYLKNNIKPVEMWEFNPIMALLNFAFILSVAIPVFIAVFGSDIVSDESTNETFKFLLIQPVSRGKILLSKFLTFLITSVTLIFGAQGIIFGIIGAIRGFKGFDQFTKVGLRYEIDKEVLLKEGYETLKQIEGTGEWITYGELLGQSLFLQLLFVIACCAVVFMISTLVKSNMVGMAVSIVLVVGGSVLPLMIPKIAKLAHLTFLGYGNAPAIINGDIAHVFNTNVNFRPGMGMVILLVTTIISYIIAHIVFEKRDILV
ncbi:hypothetical protein HMPREF1092_00053 [Clostridium thermobutyricum]|uniref:ABC transporter permease n=1 Tax=Clostridium thermobutyricum TaxID=29372 RepID=N9Y8A8_9CLOT|nr:ABC transporter permease [Clostridium thermobutyricum]ENZ04032.1 hypothetical protein HMPREF1092_00053 [Clostridium thermobutyricum]